MSARMLIPLCLSLMSIAHADPIIPRIVLVDEHRSPAVKLDMVQQKVAAERLVAKLGIEGRIESVKGATIANSNFQAQVDAAAELFQKNGGKLNEVLVEVSLYNRGDERLVKMLPKNFSELKEFQQIEILAHAGTKIHIKGIDQNNRRIEASIISSGGRHDWPYISNRAEHVLENHFKENPFVPEMSAGKKTAVVVATIVFYPLLLGGCGGGGGGGGEPAPQTGTNSGSGSNVGGSGEPDPCGCRAELTWDPNASDRARVYTAWGVGPNGLKKVGEITDGNQYTTAMRTNELENGGWDIYLTAAAAIEYGQYIDLSPGSESVPFTVPRAK